jgi:hydroxylamine reductase
MDMFCYQCQETAKGQGCTTRGVCGKTAEISALQDLVIWLLKGLSFYGVEARKRGIVDLQADRLVAEALFATITNVNFDAERFVALAHEIVSLRDGLKARLAGQALPEPIAAATWAPAAWQQTDLLAQGLAVGTMADEDENQDIRSLRQLLILGLKGLAAYTDHAYVLEHTNDDVLALLYLGVKHIRLGPTLPAFVSPSVLNVLVEKFDIMPTSTVEGDVAAIAAV